MADQNRAASQANDQGREEETFKFEHVLRDELALVVARRTQLDTERGELQGRTAAQRAWHARLLGLSFSGGGIRSATFNLGVLQALAGRGVLRYVDYLSTVSGGGYIGSWLTALSQRRFARTPENAELVGVEPASLLKLTPAGFRSFEQQLAWSAGDRRGTDDQATSEDRAIRFLREFSNYLTPKLGLFSGDTWALIAIYIRNALLNQLVLLLALVVVLLIPRLFSPALARSEAEEIVVFLLWMVAAAFAHIFICWNLGKDLARVAAVRSSEGEPAKSVLGRIGFPLLLIGISATSWLGYLGTWPLWIAALVGALVSAFTWILARESARWYARKADKAYAAAEASNATTAAKGDKTEARKAWSKVARRFWARMVWYSPLSGAVFGLLLHQVSAWLFTGAYSGFKLIAAPPALALAVLLAGVLHVGLAGKNVSAQFTEWLSRFGGVVLIGSIGWLAFNGLVFLAPLLVAWLQGLWQAVLSSGWLLTTLISVVFGRSVAAASGRWSKVFMTLAPYVFIVGLGVASAALVQQGLHEVVLARGGQAVEAARRALDDRLRGTESQEVFGRVEIGGSSVEVRGQVVEGAAAAVAAAGDGLMEVYGEWLEATEQDPIVVAVAAALAFLLCWFVSWRIDVNVFSLNGMYANRLVRCYLGASVSDRKPNRFSGLSSRDDLQLTAEARSVGGLNMLVHPLADGGEPGDAPDSDDLPVYPGPYHLINTAINLVAGGNLAYQERKAGAFLLSPLYCGFKLDSSSSEGPKGQEIDAYRYTEKFSSKPRQLTLGEAVATSGAAASPNMGYHSTPAFAFLMGVFNIRLGRWVGNPYTTDGNDKTWQKTGPKVALFHLFREVFGLTDKESGFVYLSDGGHFENLGIYELVRRRCRYIVACDAGADPGYGFEDLGNAIRKCRTDLGVEIDLDVRQIAAVDAQHYNGAPCAVGSVRYSEDEVGTILYIKASRRAGVPSDVMHYATENTAFPHESTADQFFSESQFESYRRLGYFLASAILGGSRAAPADDLDVDRLFRDLSERWYRPSTAISSNFGRLAEEVDELFERLRTSKELAFLSRQFYPEWRNLFRREIAKATPEQQIKDLLFLPPDEDELRQGFYFCNSLIQLMESVYVALDLETDWQHPDNSGWINVFNHWAWSGMFRVTWAVSAATYGGRFRAFCEQRLNLTLGDVTVEPALEPGATDDDLAASALNAHEQRQIAKLRAAHGTDLTVYRLELFVRHPIQPEPALMTFGFGYAVMRGADLLMYRVQDHLRGMGLGRRGLQELREELDRPLVPDSLDVDWLLEFFEEFHESTDSAKLADFRAMVMSVNEEAEQRKADAS